MSIIDILVTIGKILAAIFVFGIIIFVHELGHFIAARLMGVRVNEFSLGMGPKLFKFGKKETVYSLRLFPIGGFCAMEGEDEDSHHPRAFGSQKVWRRIIIIVSGVIMNILLGFLLLLIIYSTCIKPDSNGNVSFSSTVIGGFAENAPSYNTGLRVNDRILSINGKGVVTDKDIVILMQSDEDGIMDIVVRRQVDNKSEKIKIKNVQFEIQKEDGRQILIYDFSVKGIKRTPLNTITQAVKMEYSVATLIWRSLGDIVSGKYGLNELSGPVGTVGVIGDAVAGVVDSEDIRDGTFNLLMMVVFITVNVGIFNLLPLPALDGGRLIFLIYEGVFRRPVKPKYEGMIHAIGLILLLLLMVFVTFSDISRLITGS
ncbi:MAG: site-2 protease family protein [Oscillospiraceae bacterium]|nr:site-2 protease family protein [Oscillospiraceae bacterium]MDD3833017.1 site-2 protease family protein [Oscillospiraceae bacterium]MDD4546760.1 site-2 protease family protein [Oscillospiraceae bacterium]